MHQGLLLRALGLNHKTRPVRTPKKFPAGNSGKITGLAHHRAALQSAATLVYRETWCSRHDRSAPARLSNEKWPYLVVLRADLSTR